MPSELEQAIERFREQLLARESEATLAIGKAYQVTRVRLVKRIEELADAIEASGREFTPSEMVRWERAQELLRQVDAEMTSLARASLDPIQGGQADAVAMADDHAEHLTMVSASTAPASSVIAASLATTWNRVNTSAVEEFVGRMSDGSPLRVTLDGFGEKTSKIVSDALQEAIATGTNPRAVARRLSQQVDVAARRLLLISRTEILQSYRGAASLNYQANSDIISGVRWVSAHSSRTCAACLALSGQVFPVDYRMESHPACRCSLVPAVVGTERNRLPTGEAWLRRQPLDTKVAILGVEGERAFTEGRVRLSDFIQRDENERWGASYRQSSLAAAIERARRREQQAA